MQLYNRKKKLKKTGIRIGICAAEHNMGVTTLALALTNYLCSKHRKRAAYLELNGTGEIAALSGGRKESFQHLRMQIFPDVTFAQLTEIYALPMDYFVLDLGILHPNNYREFTQCDLGLVLGSAAPWKREQYGTFLQRYSLNKTNMPESIRCLISLGKKEDQKAFLHQYHIPAAIIPYLENPLKLTPLDWQFLQKLICELEL